MTESTVHTQRTYVVSNFTNETSVVHTQRTYVVSNFANETSVVHTQRVYVVSVDPIVFQKNFASGGETDPSSPPSFRYNRRQDEFYVFRANNATGITQSPFTYKQQVFKHQGERWEVDVTIPSNKKDVAEEWVTKLVKLRGSSGKILIGDPDHATQRGTATAMTVSGSVGESTITVDSLNGTLKAGDHFQLGSDFNSRLHMVLIDKSSGAGTLEIWPPLRSSYSSASAILIEPKGTFRLASNVTDWTIDNASAYGISFSAVEDLT